MECCNNDIFAMMGHRFYDPIAKRFITPDYYFLENPEKIVKSPVEGNLYSYAKNDPLRRNDPSGNQSLVTDMNEETTTFDPSPYPGESITIETKNDVASSAQDGADAPFNTPDASWVESGTESPAYGPDGAYIDTGDPRGRDVHGGGSSLPDPMAPKQGWLPTFGCTRGQNEDLPKVGEAMKEFKENFPGVKIPYSRIKIPYASE